MNRPAIIVTALVAFAIALANIVLGRNLIMPLAAAEERGAGMPWFLVWALILITAGCSIALGIFLVSSAFKDSTK